MASGGTAFVSRESNWQSILRWEAERKAALILLLVSILTLGLGLSANRWMPQLDLSPWLYGSWSAVGVLCSLGLWFSPRVRRIQRIITTGLMVAAYLMLVAVAFLNHLHPLLVGLLLIAQILLALSFMHWVEFTLFTLVSLGVFFFCAVSIPDLLLPPWSFLIVMGAGTLAAGLFTWWNSGRLAPETPADELIGHLLDQDDAALFLLDHDGSRIILRNYAAARLLNELGLPADVSGPMLLSELDLKVTYLSERMEATEPGHPERHYLARKNEQSQENRLELTFSKLPLLDTPYIRLKITDITEQVRREHQIRRSLAMNQTLLEAIPDLLITLDADNQIVDLRVPRHLESPFQPNLYLNRPLKQMLQDLLPEAEQEGIRQMLLAARRRGGLLNRAFSLEVDGRTYHYELRMVRMQQEGELLGMIRDITEAKQAEMALRRSEHSYRQIFNTGAEGIMLLNLDHFHPVDINHEATRMLGYPRLRLLQLSIGDLISPQNFDAFTDHIAQAAEGENQRFEASLLCANGEEVPVEIDLSASTFDGKERLLLVFRDIGDKLAHHRELAESELRYRTLVEHMNEGLVLTDQDERIIFVNPRMQEIFGYSEADLLDMRSYDLMGEENYSLLDNQNTLRRNGYSDEYEIKTQRSNGDALWVLIAGSPYQDAEGKVIGTIAIITDITDRKRAELKLQEKNNELDAFVYKASHDLRGPLTSIIGVANIARSETDDQPALRYLDLISKSTKRLDLILSELLDVTRITKVQVTPEPMSLSPLVEEIFGSLHHLFPVDAVSLRLDIDLPGPVVYDKRLIISILQNLVVNAINYRQPDRADAFVQVRAYHEAERLYLEVADNGSGIPERIQPKIFEMFYRGNTQSKGSGLGLYIVKSAAEKLNGRVVFTSQEGEGSTFTVILPLQLAPEPVVEHPEDMA